MHVRRYGTSGHSVIVLHGGPAAVGEAAPIARGLADSFRVLEPWQRGSGTIPLSVSRHVADLHELVATLPTDPRPALIGESWGAMLALAYGAAHPGNTGPLVLVGCGTFDTAARSRMMATIEERISEEIRQRLDQLPGEFSDPAERLEKRFELTRSLYQVDPITPEPDEDLTESFDVRAHTETWNDMLKLQAEGIYPVAFSAIESPVLMLHGTYDPHPGRMILESLKPHLPQLEYREWERCGHNPWLEREVRNEFFAVIRSWLTRRFSPREGDRGEQER